MITRTFFLRLLFILAALPQSAFAAAAAQPQPPVPEQPAVPKFNPLKALSLRSMLLGGGGLTTGAIALGLHMWRKKLQNDLIDARDMVEIAPKNSLEKFLAEHQALSLEQDIKSLKKYSRWLLIAAGFIGVGTIGSASFDMGKALAQRAAPGLPGQPAERIIRVPGSPPPPVEVPRPMHTILGGRLAAAAQRAQEVAAQADAQPEGVDFARFAIDPAMPPLEQAVRNYELAKTVAGLSQRHDDMRREQLANDALVEELQVPLDPRERDEYLAGAGMHNGYADRIIEMNRILNQLYPPEQEGGVAGARMFPETREGVFAALAEEGQRGVGGYANDAIVPAHENDAVQIEIALKKWENDEHLLENEAAAQAELGAVLERASQPVQERYRERVGARINLRAIQEQAQQDRRAAEEERQAGIEATRQALDVQQPAEVAEMAVDAVAEHYSGQIGILRNLSALGGDEVSGEVAEHKAALLAWVRPYFEAQIDVLVDAGRAAAGQRVPEAIKRPNRFKELHDPLFRAISKVGDAQLLNKLQLDLVGAQIEPNFSRLDGFRVSIDRQFNRTESTGQFDQRILIKLPDVGAQLGRGDTLMPLDQIFNDGWFRRLELFKDLKSLFDHVEEDGHDEKREMLDEVAQGLGFANSGQAGQFDSRLAREVCDLVNDTEHFDREAGAKVLDERLGGLQGRVVGLPDSLVKRHLAFWLDQAAQKVQTN